MLTKIHTHTHTQRAAHWYHPRPPHIFVIVQQKGVSKIALLSPSRSTVIHPAWILPNFNLLRCRVVFQKHLGADLKLWFETPNLHRDAREAPPEVGVGGLLQTFLVHHDHKFGFTRSVQRIFQPSDPTHHQVVISRQLCPSLHPSV